MCGNGILVEAQTTLAVQQLDNISLRGISLGNELSISLAPGFIPQGQYGMHEQGLSYLLTNVRQMVCTKLA